MVKGRSVDVPKEVACKTHHQSDTLNLYLQDATIPLVDLQSIPTSKHAPKLGVKSEHRMVTLSLLFPTLSKDGTLYYVQLDILQKCSRRTEMS